MHTTSTTISTTTSTTIARSARRRCAPAPIASSAIHPDHADLTPRRRRLRRLQNRAEASTSARRPHRVDPDARDADRPDADRFDRFDRFDADASHRPRPRPRLGDARPDGRGSPHPCVHALGDAVARTAHRMGPAKIPPPRGVDADEPRVSDPTARRRGCRRPSRRAAPMSSNAVAAALLAVTFDADSVRDSNPGRKNTSSASTRGWTPRRTPRESPLRSGDAGEVIRGDGRESADGDARNWPRGGGDGDVAERRPRARA